MLRHIFIIFILYSQLLFGGFGNSIAIMQPKFLKPSEAFKVKAYKTKNSLDIKITLANKIHIYKNSLDFKIVSPKRINLSPKLPQAKLLDEDRVYEHNLSISIPLNDIESKVSGIYKLEVKFQGCSDEGMCYQPIVKSFEFNSSKDMTLSDKFSSLISSGNTQDIANALANENVAFILLVFFVAGLLMALTPCILPMIPILSSIILQQAKSDGEIKKSSAFLTSSVYVVSMALMYAIIGVVAGLLDFDLQANMNNPWVIVPVAGIFVALAFSLFGYYEIALPHSLQAKLNRVSDNAHGKGLIGTAIMGAISALLVGACTAPIIGGAILFIVITGKALLGGVALFVMGIGAGMPLLLVGMGANKLVPKPGSWMSMVSKLFGVMMLIMAIALLYRLVPNDTTSQGYSVQRLLSEVNSTNKPVIVDFSKAGCAACKELEEITFPNKQVKEQLKRFKFIHIDITKYSKDDQAMLKKYNLFGAPNLIFFDSNHTYLPNKNLSGFVKPKDLAKHMNDIR
jgi:thiol:disulfide interchange protein DsbD